MQKDPQLLQTIIAIGIVLAAFIFIVYKVVRKIKQPVSGCSGCSSDCSGCELTSLKKEIGDAKKRSAKVTAPVEKNI